MLFKSKGLTIQQMEAIYQHLKIISDDGCLHFYNFPSKTDSYHLPFNIQLSVNLRGKRFDAWGKGQSEDEATLKATAELVERIIATHSYPYYYRPLKFFNRSKTTVAEIQKKFPHASNWIAQSTSGVAIHTDLNMAKNNALNELIERHTILKALILKKVPQRIIYSSVLSKYKLPPNVTANFYYWIGPLHRKVALTEIIYQRSYYYGQGTSTDLKEALASSFMEVSGKLIFAVNQFDKNVTTNFNQDYYRAGQDDSLHLFLSHVTDQAPVIDQQIKKEDFYWNTIEVPNFLKLSETKLKAVRFISPKLQAHFTGQWQENKINPEAISLAGESLPGFPHMIG